MPCACASDDGPAEARRKERAAAVEAANTSRQQMVFSPVYDKPRSPEEHAACALVAHPLVEQESVTVAEAGARCQIPQLLSQWFSRNESVMAGTLCLLPSRVVSLRVAGRARTHVSYVFVCSSRSTLEELANAPTAELPPLPTTDLHPLPPLPPGMVAQVQEGMYDPATIKAMATAYEMGRAAGLRESEAASEATRSTTRSLHTIHDSPSHHLSPEQVCNELGSKYEAQDHLKSC